MINMFLVKEGRTFLWPSRMKTVAAFDSYEECEKWIYDNIEDGQHMYIEPVERLTEQDFKDMLETHIIIPMKGARNE